jgi:MFS family permease
MSTYGKLSIAFGIEVLNLVTHRVLHHFTDGVGWADTLSTAISLAIIFVIGWIVGRSGARYAAAILAAVAFWVFSTIVAIVLTAMTMTGRMDLDALKGYVLAMAVFLPIGLGIAAIAVAAARRIRAS